MGRVWKKHSEASRPTAKELDRKQRNKRELASSSASKQSELQAGHSVADVSFYAGLAVAAPTLATRFRDGRASSHRETDNARLSARHVGPLAIAAQSPWHDPTIRNAVLAVRASVSVQANSRDASSGSLPSEGIMAIYQQFRQIWRRQPQQARPFVPLPPQLLRQTQWRLPEDLILHGSRARGTAAAAA